MKFAVFLFLPALLAQPKITLSAAPSLAGQQTTIDVTLSGSVGLFSGLQWGIPALPGMTAVAGPATTLPGKTLSCGVVSGEFRCLVSGNFTSLLNDGVIAQIGVVMPNAPTPLPVGATFASLATDPAGTMGTPVVSGPLFTLTSSLAAPVRINSGGPQFVDGTGNQWQADELFTGGTASLDPKYAGPVQYASKRYGSFTYTIPIVDGQYTLVLHFLEGTVTGAGARVFNVSANGVPLLSNYDTFADVGLNVPVQKTFTVTAAAGTGIRLAFSTVVRSAFVNGLELLPVSINPPVSGITLTCKKGLVVSSALTAASNTQDVTVWPALSPFFRIEHVALINRVVWSGMPALSVSMLAAGEEIVPSQDLLQPLRWYDRPSSPLSQIMFSQFVPPGNTIPADPTAGSFPFDVVLRFAGSVPFSDGTNPNLNLFGQTYYEVCGYAVQPIP